MDLDASLVVVERPRTKSYEEIDARAEACLAGRTEFLWKPRNAVRKVVPQFAHAVVDPSDVPF